MRSKLEMLRLIHFVSELSSPKNISQTILSRLALRLGAPKVWGSDGQLF